MIIASTEYRRAQLDYAYAGFFGRQADPEGLNFWVEALQQGTRYEELIRAFVTSEEYARKWGAP